jgi:hypothetical protein
MGRYELDLPGPGYGQVKGSCERGKENSESIKCWEFLSSCTTKGFSRRVHLHGVSSQLGLYMF